MNILFVMDKRVNAGSIHAVANYIREGDQLGHTIALYGRQHPSFPHIRFSTDLEAFDYVLFIIEADLSWMSNLRMSPILSQVPRHRRAIVDTDGMYNKLITVDGYDRNHRSEYDRGRWLTHYESLADKIFQPTFQALEPRVLSVPFYGYDPMSATEINSGPRKQFDVVYVGHNWWRWQEMSTRFLPALERIRDRVDGVCLVGAWWDGMPPVCNDPDLERAFSVDLKRLQQLRINVKPAVPYTKVIRTMSQGRVNIMAQRPLLRYLKLLTSKYFEVFCADTIPLVMLDPDHAESIYGPEGRKLALDYDAADKLLDALSQPHKFWEIVYRIRQHLTVHHSYRNRVQELVVALQSRGQDF